MPRIADDIRQSRKAVAGLSCPLPPSVVLIFLARNLLASDNFFFQRRNIHIQRHHRKTNARKNCATISLFSIEFNCSFAAADTTGVYLFILLCKNRTKGTRHNTVNTSAEI